MAYSRVSLLFVVLLGLTLGPHAAQARPVRGATCPTGSAVVVLDPGHGGSDPGAVNNRYGLAEEYLTLQIAAITSDLLSDTYSVALTRSSDVGLGNSERGAIANACGAQVFVSIHLNSATNPSIDYTQTFWGKKNKDLAFSRVVNQTIASQLGIANNGVGQFANGGLLTATMPSTLAETVFISSDYEAQRLSDGSIQRQTEIAQGIANGVRAWLG